jgi:hypothetical protein
MRRPGYREAVEWLVMNDDCEWLDDHDYGHISVSAALVRDLFGIEDERLFADMRRLRSKL